MNRHFETPQALTFYRVYGETDLREMLPTIRVPTLVLYRRPLRDQMLDLARRIKGAQAMEIEGTDFKVFNPMTREVEAFLTGMETEPVPDTVLATVMFTDIVGSTERAATLGDRAWRDLLHDHHILVRRELARFRGEEVDTAGDGFFATFDGPARAISCACAIVGAAGELGLTVRVGVHTGECELQDGKVTGIAVSIGARVAAAAGAGEVLVSGTVKDLVAGSGIEFHEKGRAPAEGRSGRVEALQHSFRVNERRTRFVHTRGRTEDERTPLDRSWTCGRLRGASSSNAATCSHLRQLRMERLWSPAGATSGNQRQIARPQKRLKQAKSW